MTHVFSGRLLLAACATALLPFTAAAQEARSAYTAFDADKCRHEAGTAEEDGGSWTCRGYGAGAIRLELGDQRMMVSFGSVKNRPLSASQTFPAFNNVYKGTVEWRLAGSPKAAPYAAILRWNVMTDADREKADGPVESTGRVLVVTRLGKDGECHIGYVDARANADANDIARRIADEKAASFRCGTDKAEVRGAVTPGLAMP